MKKSWYLFSFNFLLCLYAGSSFAQEDSILSGQSFSTEEYFENILQHHPIVRQTRLLNDLTRQELRLARGSFDPKLKSTYAIKEFGGTKYYNTWDSKLEVPVWFNTDLNIGYEQNDGKYLNEQLQNTSDGLIYAGVSVPIGRGLFTDERRATVRQAQILQDMAEADKLKEINKVLLTAAKAYWDWFYTFESYQVTSEVSELAEKRYAGIVQQVLNGDIAPFDSLKAYINYQERDLQRRQAALDYANARLQVANFLWLTDSADEQSIPVQLAENTYPLVGDDEIKTLDLLTLQTLQDSAQVNHPELIKLRLKNQQLEVEQRLNREFLKPEINLKYNLLWKPGSNGDILPEVNSSVFMNDYKLGMEVYFPLLLRKERAKLQKTTIKLEQNYYERANQARSIENDIHANFNTLTNLTDLISMQVNMVSNYQALLGGEIIKFENGESSVFLINTRETELLDARVKLLKLQAQYEKAKVELMYAAGVPYLQY